MFAQQNSAQMGSNYVRRIPAEYMMYIVCKRALVVIVCTNVFRELRKKYLRMGYYGVLIDYP